MSSGATYDANGDVLSDSLHSYAWDSQARPTTIDTITVTYDALGRMVEQSNSGTNTEIQYSPTGFEMHLMNGQTAVQGTVPMPGGTAEVWNTNPSVIYYRHSDWLGSSRFASTTSRTMYNDLAYAPFGEQYAAAGTTGVTNTSFAGNGEYTTANLYDAANREYEIYGRWPSPDPAGMAAANPANPQSWNRYAYALNNPLLLVDPSGLDTCFVPADVPGGYYEVDSTPAECDELGGTLGAPDTTVTVNGGGDDGGDPFPPLPTPTPFTPTLPTLPNGTGNYQAPPQPPKPLTCTESAVLNGAKAAASDLVPVPPQFNGDNPAEGALDAATSKQGAALITASLFQISNYAKFLSPVADVGVDAVPVVGEFYLVFQAGHAVVVGVEAAKESFNQCSGGNQAE